MLEPTPRSPRTQLRRLAVAAVVLCAFATFGRGAAAEDEPRVLIIKENQAQFDEAISGVTAAMRRAGLRPKMREVVLDRRKKSTYDAAVLAAREYKPAVVVAIGTEATRLSQQRLEEFPLVFAMVLNPVQSGILKSMDASDTNLTGAAIDIPVALQLRKFREVVPKLTRVGVLSNPAATGVVIAEARRVAATLGMTLKVENVATPGDVPAALDRLLNGGIDGLWTVADVTVLAPANIGIIVKECLRAGVPTMAIHPRYCEKAGFMCALALDYKDNGRQAGELATRVVQGTQPSEMAIVLPRDVKLVLNLHTARLMRHKFAPGVVRSATIVKK